MPVPKRRVSRSRQGNRRSHIHLKSLKPQKCARCQSPKLPHRVCPTCGFYKEVEVLAQK